MNAFIGEFLILSGTFKANMVIGGFSILGIVLGVVYMVWFYYRIALNEINSKTKTQLFDLDLREIATLIPLVILIFFIGLQPSILLSYIHVSVEHLIENINTISIIDNIEFHDSINLLVKYFKEIIDWV